MADTPLGKLKYKDGGDNEGRWAGYAPLPALAAHATRTPDAPVTDADAEKMVHDMNQAMEGLKGLMREKYGDKVDAAFAALDAEHEKAFDDMFLEMQQSEDEEPDPREAERERKRAGREQKRAAKLAAGRFPVRVTDPDGGGPSEPQTASMRHLAENEPAVAAAVLKEVWDSFQSAYSQEHWRRITDLKPAASVEELRGTFALTDLTVTREHRAGFAHLVFGVEARWGDEHGLLVVYSPDTRECAWTSYDGLYDLIPSDDAEEGEEYVETPHDQLVNAIFANELDRARELAAAGADINAVNPEHFPPLCAAVDQMEVEHVRRLLEFGADPNLADADSGKTPLKMAKRAYRDMGFAPSKKKDPLLDAMMDMMKEAAAGPMADMKKRLDDIIAMLEKAGGK
jgi:hypothetical protein